MWKVLVISAFFVSLAAFAEPLPKSKVPLPSKPQLGAMGSARFLSWCYANVEGGAAQIDEMMLYYRDVRDELTATEAGKLSGPEALQLEQAMKAITTWVYRRSELSGAYKGGSMAGHAVPMLLAELADTKHQCVVNWGVKAPPPAGAPQSYRAMVKGAFQPFSGDLKSAQELAASEESALAQARLLVGKLPAPARARLNAKLLDIAERLNPTSRG